MILSLRGVALPGTVLKRYGYSKPNEINKILNND